MDWKEYYKSRTTTAEEAIKVIKDGDHVVFGHCAGEPQHIIDALLDHAEDYHNVTIHHMNTLGKGRYTAGEFKDNFHFDGWFLSPSTLGSVAAGYADVTPNHYFQATQWLEQGVFKDDVAIVMVTPPDARGFVCLGVSVDYTYPAIKNARTVIAQVNSHMPVTYGDTLIHVSEIDCFVEADQELNQFLPPHFGKLGDKDLAIGQYCASLIPDGATVSIGIGSIPDAVCYCLKGKKELGVFTDMFSDGMMQLYQEGYITNEHCTTDPGVMTTSFIMGSKELYDFVDHNPAVRFKTAEYVNHPYRLSRQSQMCIVNSCVGVDLSGQIVSASIGELQLSGTGGQPSLNRGATMSADRRGISIIAMTSSVEDFNTGKKVSKITPFIAKGAEVSMVREAAGYIVTEYGIANLKGKTLDERSRALIEIADPEFRPELIEEFERRYKMKY